MSAPLRLSAASATPSGGFPLEVSQQEPPADPAAAAPAAQPAIIVQGLDDFAITAEEVAAAISELAAMTGLDEATRASIAQMHQATQKKLESIAQIRSRLAEFEKRIADTSVDTEAAAKNRDLLLNARPVDADAYPQLDQLKQIVTQTQAELEAAQKLVATLKDEPARRLARASEIPGLIGKAEQKLAEIRAQLAVAPPENEPAIQTRARRMQIRAAGQELERELESLRREQLYYGSTGELLLLQQEVAQLQASSTAKNLEILQQTLIRRQESRLQTLQRATREEAATAPPELKTLAERNLELARKTLLYNDRGNQVSKQLKEVTAQHADVEQQMQTAVDRFKSVGLTDALGGMLRKQRRDLELLLQQNRPSAAASAEIRALQVEIFQLQDELAALPADSELVVSLSTAVPGLSESERDALETAALPLVVRQKSLMNELNLAADQQFRHLVSLDTEKRKTVAKITGFLEWIDTRVIWIPSAPVFATGDWKKGLEAVSWFLSPANWETVGRELVLDLQTNFAAFFPFLLAVLVLILFRPRLKRIIRESGAEASRSRCAAILPTINCLTATVLMAALWPMVLAVLGWTLSHGPDIGSFVASVGVSLVGVAVFVAPLELLRNVCRNQGLAELHFAWPERTRTFLMAILRNFYFFSLPVLFGQGVMAAQPNDEWKNSLGRFFSCLLFSVAAWYLHRVFRPTGTVFQQMGAQRPVPRLWHFRSLIHLILVFLPLTLLGLALAGYYYTAFQLGACLELSLSLLIVMIILGGLVFRWLLVRRRSLAMEEARKTRLALAAASESSAPGAEAMAASAEKALLDLTAVSRQAREIADLLLGATTFFFLFWIWRDVLPAVGILDQKVLWNVTIHENVEAVTLKNLFLAALTTAFTWLMIRNMPGLLNLAVQQFSVLDSGARYAATTIFRYLITVIGAVVALGFLKIQWGQYSWLVAAVTVGLGFGLQEIVANFVSGLILLFERPVRVGDMITIENTNGVVTRIQMRATTVMTIDHQELIVPNKELVTGKLLNWTLSSFTNRLVLEVGVAYGTDPDRVRDLLTETVSRHPEVMRDPPPTVNLESFGDSSLVFRIRCFLPGVDQRIKLRHELNTAIAHALHQAGIPIPFPQRDVHFIPASHDGEFPEKNRKV